MSASMGHDDSGGGLRYTDQDRSELIVAYASALRVRGAVVIKSADTVRQGKFETSYQGFGPAGGAFSFDGKADAFGASHVHIENQNPELNEIRTNVFSLYYFPQADQTRTMSLQVPDFQDTVLAEEALTIGAEASELSLTWTAPAKEMYVGIIKGYPIRDSTLVSDEQEYVPLDNLTTYHIEGADDQYISRNELLNAQVTISYIHLDPQKNIPDEQIHVFHRPSRYQLPSGEWNGSWQKVSASVSNSTFSLTGTEVEGFGLRTGTYVACRLKT